MFSGGAGLSESGWSPSGGVGAGWPLFLSNGEGDVVIYGRGRWSGYNLRLYRFEEGDTVLRIEV